jgi:hypothetical protein
LSAVQTGAKRPSPFDARALPAGERVLSELALLLLSVACVWPIFYVRYAPIQDLPQHLAAVRVLHDFDDPTLGFARFFELQLSHTQYLAYYAAAHLLCTVLDVELANKLLIALTLVATPITLGKLLQALGRDERIAWLAFPLAYNAHLVLGFLNFLSAIPLLFYGLTLAIRQRRQATQMRGLGLAAIGLLTFYGHVVPFALLALGVGLVSIRRDFRATLGGVAPLLPSAAAAFVWLHRSPAGNATLTAAVGSEHGKKPDFLPFEAALHETPRWLTDVLAGEADRSLLWAWCGLCGLVALLALWGALRRSSDEPASPDRLARSLGLRLALLCPLCGALYFVLPTGYDWIWPIAQRFPLLCALFLLLALPDFGAGKRAVLVLALGLSSASFHHAGSAFAAFERDEVGDFEPALRVIPKGQRVAGLIFDRGSRNVAFSPFIHYVAYYQARKGGAVMFSFADFPQSPFRFREHNRPPRVPPRWEWLPGFVRPARDLGWYDYVLVRGGPGTIARPASGFAPIYRGARYSVWKRQESGADRAVTGYPGRLP